MHSGPTSGKHQIGVRDNTLMTLLRCRLPCSPDFLTACNNKLNVICFPNQTACMSPLRVNLSHSSFYYGKDNNNTFNLFKHSSTPPQWKKQEGHGPNAYLWLNYG
ncbi:hypothetical protein AMECASPLE_012881 [Ameca splendens]|uniref:Uncharacterized protein n=1 Tax=Ameca splendens TaxID=208324 RepID=A0ABV0YZV9_9TELE